MGVEVDVTRDVTARATVVVDPQDLLLGPEIQVRPARVLDELEAAELEVADVVVARAQGRRGQRGRAVRRGRDRPRRAVGLLDVDDGLGRVVEVDPLVGGEVALSIAGPYSPSSELV